jgi:hypothetical protein
MIELGMIQHLQHGVHRTSLGVFGAVNEAANARVSDGSRTHGAGLDSDVEIAIRQTVIADYEAGFTNRLHLSVSGGVVVGDGAITAPSHNVAILNDYRAHRDLAQGFSAPRFAQGFFHEEFVGMGHKKQLAISN